MNSAEIVNATSSEVSLATTTRPRFQHSGRVKDTGPDKYKSSVQKTAVIDTSSNTVLSRVSGAEAFFSSPLTAKYKSIAILAVSLSLSLSLPYVGNTFRVYLWALAYIHAPAADSKLAGRAADECPAAQYLSSRRFFQSHWNFTPGQCLLGAICRQTRK